MAVMIPVQLPLLSLRGQEKPYTNNATLCRVRTETVAWKHTTAFPCIADTDYVSRCQQHETNHVFL